MQWGNLPTRPEGAPPSHCLARVSCITITPTAYMSLLTLVKTDVMHNHNPYCIPLSLPSPEGDGYPQLGKEFVGHVDGPC